MCGAQDSLIHTAVLTHDKLHVGELPVVNISCELLVRRATNNNDGPGKIHPSEHILSPLRVGVEFQLGWSNTE